MDFAKFLSKVADLLDGKNTPEGEVVANAIDMAIQEAEPVLSIGVDPFEATVVANLITYAGWLDCDGHTKIAETIDLVVKQVVGLKVDAMLSKAAAEKKNDRADLYDAAKHREQSLYNKLVEDVKKAEPELNSWKDGGHPLVTRYSPDYPGVMMLRISDGVFQDMLSNLIMDSQHLRTRPR